MSDSLIDKLKPVSFVASHEVSPGTWQGIRCVALEDVRVTIAAMGVPERKQVCESVGVSPATPTDTLIQKLESANLHFNDDKRLYATPDNVTIDAAELYSHACHFQSIANEAICVLKQREISVVDDSTALYWKRKYHERVEQGQSLHMEYCELRDDIARALGISVGRESWWDSGDTSKKEIILKRVAKLRSPKRESGALTDIAAERQRQIDKEGWTPEHDDEHNFGQLALAGACYALSGGSQSDIQRDSLARMAYDAHGSDTTVAFSKMWPWELSWWKPKNRRSDLIRAAALIVAELERMDRAKKKIVETEEQKP